MMLPLDRATFKYKVYVSQCWFSGYRQHFWTQVALYRWCVTCCKALCSSVIVSASIYLLLWPDTHSAQRKSGTVFHQHWSFFSLLPIIHQLTSVCCDGKASLWTERGAPYSERRVLSIRTVRPCPPLRSNHHSAAMKNIAGDHACTLKWNKCCISNFGSLCFLNAPSKLHLKLLT